MMSRGLIVASAGVGPFDRVSFEGSLVVGGCGLTLMRRRPGLLVRACRFGSGFVAGSTGEGEVSVAGSAAAGIAVVSVRAVISGSGSSIRAPLDVTRLTFLSERSLVVRVESVALASEDVGAVNTGSKVPAKRML